jgi:hypothetical protein
MFVETVFAIETVPETGPGLSGFLAHALWHVYRHFPDRVDWLVLFLAFGTFVHFSFLPLLWRAVEADMRYLEAKQATEEAQNGMKWLWFWSVVWLSFLLWFFHTPAGRTLLNGRHVMGYPLLEPLRTGPYVGSAFATLMAGVALSLISDRAKALGESIARTQAFPRCGFLEAWSGGGVFFQQTPKGVQRAEPVGVLQMEFLFLFMLHTCYWYWSIASLLLMYGFVLTLIVAEAARLMYVAILHRRTFG